MIEAFLFCLIPFIALPIFALFVEKFETLLKETKNQK